MNLSLECRAISFLLFSKMYTYYKKNIVNRECGVFYEKSKTTKRENILSNSTYQRMYHYLLRIYAILQAVH